MRRATFSILFYLKKSKKTEDNVYPIYVRITIKGSRAEFSMQQNISEKSWNPVKGRVRGLGHDVKKINSSLEYAKSKLYGYKIELEQEGKLVTPTSLKDKYKGVSSSDEKTILGIFKEHNDRCKKLVNIDFAPGTVERYETSYKHVKNFMYKAYNKKDVALDQVTPKFIRDFEYYLKVERKCNHNTTTKYLKNFKKIIRIALANYWINKDPFSNMKFHLKEVDIAFLTEKELTDIMSKQIDIERLRLVRDVYIFACFTGLAFIDVKNLKRSHIENIDGALWIKKRRQKTKNWSHIPLLEPAIDIINKYENHPTCRETEFLLPVMTNQKMNAYLKEIADICGIKKNLSTHTARHTFATTVTLSNNISIEVVSKMLGHSSINMTKKYARVVDDLIQRDMQKLQGKYKTVSKS